MIVTQDLFVYEITGEDDDGNIAGRHVSTGIARPKFWDRAPLFRGWNANWLPRSTHRRRRAMGGDLSFIIAAVAAFIAVAGVGLAFTGGHQQASGPRACRWR